MLGSAVRPPHSRILPFLCLAGAMGVIVGLLVGVGQIAEQDYLRQGLWRTSLWIAGHHALLGALLGIAAALLFFVALAAWIRAISSLRKLLDLPPLPPRTGPLLSPPIFRFALFLVISSGAAALAAPIHGYGRLGLPIGYVALASLAGSWLLVSGLAAAMPADLTPKEQSQAWFRLQWLALVGLVCVVILLHLWAGARPLRQATLLALGVLVVSAAVFFLLYRPARFLRDRIAPGFARASRLVPARGIAVGLLGLAAALWMAGTAARVQVRAQAAARGRNVLIIAVDDVRYDRVSLFSKNDHDRDLTPNLRRLLAARGTVFTDAITQAPWTLPAFSSIFTGLYPEQHGAEPADGQLSPRQLTLAEILSEAGYRAMGVGSGSYLGPKFGLGQGFAPFQDSTGASSEQVTNAALRFLQAERSTPFFVFLHYFDPHPPLMNHREFDIADKCLPRLRAQWRASQRRLSSRAGPPLANLLRREYRRALYDEEIAYTDLHIGRLLAYLDQAGLWDSTLVIFLADHGEEFSDHGGSGHTVTLYQELIHVPLVIAAPSSEAPPIADRPVETRWIFRTVLDFLGVALPPNATPGRSLLEAPRPGQTFVRSATHPYPHVTDPNFPARRRVWLSCLVGGRWKLIKNHKTGRARLFDLLNDPAERRDCSNDYPEVRRQMESILDRQDADLRSAAPSHPRRELDEEQRRLLKDLGYL